MLAFAMFAAPAICDLESQNKSVPLAPITVEGGSEFAAEFEPAGRQRGLHRFVLPRAPPQLNRAVERAHRTHTQEFYPLTTGCNSSPLCHNERLPPPDSSEDACTEA